MYHSLLRMSGKLLIQRHGISYSRVNACYGFNKVSWTKSIPPPNFRNQKSSSNLIVNASKPRVGSGGYRSTSQVHTSLFAFCTHEKTNWVGLKFV